MAMKSKTVLETAMGTTNLFYKKCKECGEMTVNYGTSEHEKNGQSFLYFRCYACGNEWKSKAYKYSGFERQQFTGFWNKFARPLAASWKGKKQIAIVLDQNWVLLVKSGKEKRVPSSEVNLADGFYKLTMENIPIHLVGMEDIYNAGYMMHYEKCDCGAIVFHTRINNIALIKSVEKGNCRNCGKTYESLRYNVDPCKLRYILKLKSKKSGKVLYGIESGSGYEVYKEGRVLRVPANKVEVLGNNSMQSTL